MADEPLTKEEVLALNIDQLIEIREGDTFRRPPNPLDINSTHFVHYLSQAASQERDPRVTRLYSVLSSAILLPVNPNDPNPYGVPEAQLAYPLMESGVLSPADALVLEWIISTTSVLALKARLADLLWVLAGQPDQARLAVTTYLELEEQLNDPEDWIAPSTYLARALDISKRLGKTNPKIAEILNTVEQRLRTVNGSDTGFYSYHLLTLMAENKRATPELLAITQRLAQTETSSVDFSPHRSEQKFGLVVRLAKQLEDEEAARVAVLELASIWQDQAEQLSSRENASMFNVANYYQKAIESLRILAEDTVISNLKNELEVKMLEAQQAGRNQMPIFSFPINLTDPGLSASRSAFLEALDKPEFILALSAFALFVPPISRETLQSAADYESRLTFTQLFPPVAVDDKGRTVAVPLNDDEIMDSRMTTHLSLLHQVYDASLLRVALRELSTRFSIREEDFAPLIVGNPAVPPGHEHFLMRAFNQVFHGDFASALHLLLPQLEASLRYILNQLGEVTTTNSPAGIQVEKSLTSLLEEEPFKSKLSEILGEDFRYELRALLVSRHGANLRNRLSHGLLTPAECYGYSAIRLIQLALRLYMGSKYSA